MNLYLALQFQIPPDPGYIKVSGIVSLYSNMSDAINNIAVSDECEEKPELKPGDKVYFAVVKDDVILDSPNCKILDRARDEYGDRFRVECEDLVLFADGVATITGFWQKGRYQYVL